MHCYADNGDTEKSRKRIMAVPRVIIDTLKALPAKDLEQFCKGSKMLYKGKRLTSTTLIKILETGDKTAIKLVYDGIAPMLMVGGMWPGVGLICNLIDAAFCWIIGAWLDFAIDAISIALFEVPGVSGLKGVSKGMLALCKGVKIDAKAFWKIIDRLGQYKFLREVKVHQLFTLLMDPANKMMEFVDVKAIYKSVMKANFYRWGPGLLEKIGKECEACGVKAIDGIKAMERNAYTINALQSVNSYNVQFGELVVGRYMQIHKGL